MMATPSECFRISCRTYFFSHFPHTCSLVILAALPQNTHCRGPFAIATPTTPPESSPTPSYHSADSVAGAPAHGPRYRGRGHTLGPGPAGTPTGRTRHRKPPTRPWPWL